MFWSGWGRERTAALIQDAGFEVLIDEVRDTIELSNGSTQIVRAPHYWVMARKRTRAGSS